MAAGAAVQYPRAPVLNDPAETAKGGPLNFTWSRRLPLVTQSEASECGLACLAMIAGYHGNRTGLAELRQRFQPSPRGCNLVQLAGIAGRLGLNPRPLRAELDALPQLRCPCILHWNLDHYVVLKSANRHRLEIHDPARGYSQMRLEDAGRYFTGVALELAPAGNFERSTAVPSLRLRDLWSNIIGLKRNLAQVLLLSLLLQLFAIAAPFYMQTVVDDVILRGDAGLLATLAAGFFLLLVIEAGTQALRGSVILQLSTLLHLQLAANLFHHLLRLPLAFFQRRHLGDVLSRFSSLESIRDILGTGLVTAVVDGVMALAMLGIMLIYDARLTALVLVAVLLYGGLRVALFPALRRLSRESIAGHALAESGLIESVRAIQTVKLFQRESERQGTWQNRLAEAMNSDIRIGRLGIGFRAANTMVYGIENIAVVYLAAHGVISGSLSLGMVFAFMSYKRRFTAALDSLVDQLIELGMLGLHLQRISDIALAKKEEPPVAATVGCNPGVVALRGRQLAFRYSPADPWIFRGLDLDIAPGSCVAVVGPSGAGKSTLLKCLMGLLPPSEGELSAGELSIARHPAYRSLIGSVMQDDYLLGGSIADNIACFDPQPDPARIQSCAHLACIHTDILRLPMQYNTPVGDLGTALSGGQVQRILLARALYRRPRILFLDEATSHVDPDTERQINHPLAGMRLTRVIVAHRQETRALAQAVIEL